MAYQDPSDPQDQNDGSQITLSREQIRSMERDAKEARAAKRELAFVKAGIDTDTPLGTLFATAYEGPLDKEAIETAWKAVAPAPAAPSEPPPPAAEEEPPPPAADASFEEERRRLAAGSDGDDGTPPDRDPRKVAIETGQKLLQDGKSREDAMAEAFSSIAGAAAAGDSRVIWSP